LRVKYRRLGSAGLQLSEIAIGTSITFVRQVDDDVSLACLTAAYAGGVNFFDTAESYANGQAEALLGRLLKKTGWRRSSYVVSTKFYWGLHEGPNEHYTLSRKRLMEGIAGSLERLQLEYVDLIYAHRPDPETPVEETVRAMDDIIHRGYALYWGTSEWSADAIMQAYGIARQYGLYPPQMEQPEYNLFHRHRVEKEYARLYSEIGLGTTIWSPLYGGVLTGKYNDGVPAGSRATVQGKQWIENNVTPQRVAKVKALAEVAAGLDCTLAQLALAWCLTNPNVSTVITGASRPEQMNENLEAPAIAEKLTPDARRLHARLSLCRPAAAGSPRAGDSLRGAGCGRGLPRIAGARRAIPARAGRHAMGRAHGGLPRPGGSYRGDRRAGEGTASCLNQSACCTSPTCTSAWKTTAASTPLPAWPRACTTSSTGWTR
jgi:voltage-dependent potassium channel beta subunit